MPIKYDTRGEDHGKNASGGYVSPRPGVYICRIVDCKVGFKDKKDPETERVEVVYEIIEDGASKGFRGYDYISTQPSSKWKLDQYLQAVGVNTEEKPTGTHNEKDDVGKVVRVKFKDDSYTNPEGETTVRSKPNGVFKYGGDAQQYGDAGKGPFDDSDVDADDEVDLDTLAALADDGDADADAAIRAYIEEIGSEIDPDTIDTWVEVVELIRAELGETDATAEDPEEVKDYSEWDVEALRAECKVRELNAVGSRATLIARLEKWIPRTH